MLPDGWHRSSLGDCTDLLTGYAFSSHRYVARTVSGVRLLRGDNIVQGSVRWVDPKYWAAPYDKQLARYELRPGDIVIAMDRPIVGAGLKCSVIHPRDLPCLLVQRVARLRAKEDIDQSFLAQVLQTHHFIQHLQGQKTETAVPHISPFDIRDFSFAVPPKGEQHRIGRVLACWDEAIVTTERLLANSRVQKEALAELLLSGKRRLVRESDWPKKHLSELVAESRLIGSGGHAARKLTVKLYGRGVIGKNDKRVGSASTQYYRRTARQFIYSKLDFLNGAFGLVPDDLDGFESTLDLPAFDFVGPVNPRWFLHHVSRPAFYLGHLGLANGGRKARRVNPSDLLRLTISTPSLGEQNAIANAIDAAETDTENFDRQLALLRQQKQALMAQLITGRRRLREPEPSAETAA